MKSRRKLLLSAVVIVTVLALIIFILNRPTKIEGLYSAGDLITSPGGDSHYLRFHNGSVIHYSENNKPNLIGRYEANTNGSNTVYLTPVHRGDPEIILFEMDKPRIGYATATITEDGEVKSSFLMRIFGGNSNKIIKNQEIKQVTISNGDTIVTTYYDPSLNLIRKDIKTLKTPKSKLYNTSTPLHSK